MPCRCSGLNMRKCTCKIIGYPLKESDSRVVLMTKNETIGSSRLKTVPRSIFVRMAENVYEKCAGYNLRYCKFCGFLKRNNCFWTIISDVFVLFCFIVANFVVFVTILIKIICHTCFYLVETSQYTKRYLLQKSQDSDPIAMRPISLYVPTPQKSILNKFSLFKKNDVL